MPDTKLLKSQIEGLMMLEQDANARITNYLKLCCVDLGLDPEKTVYDRIGQCFKDAVQQPVAQPTNSSGSTQIDVSEQGVLTARD